MIISHVKIIAFQLSLFCKNYRFSKTTFINRKIHGCLEIPDLFLVLNMISTLEINLVFSVHPCIILYIIHVSCLVIEVVVFILNE
jgi:hypothetical protein